MRGNSCESWKRFEVTLAMLLRKSFQLPTAPLNHPSSLLLKTIALIPHPLHRLLYQMASRGKSKSNLRIQLESPKTASYLTMCLPKLTRSAPKVPYHLHSRRLQPGNKTHYPRPRSAPSRRRKHHRPPPRPLLGNNLSLNLLALVHHHLSSPKTLVPQPGRQWRSPLLEAASSMGRNPCLFPSRRRVHDPLHFLSRPRCRTSRHRALLHHLTPCEAILILPLHRLSRMPDLVAPRSNLIDRNKLTLLVWERRRQCRAPCAYSQRDRDWMPERPLASSRICFEQWRNLIPLSFSSLMDFHIYITGLSFVWMSI